MGSSQVGTSLQFLFENYLREAFRESRSHHDTAKNKVFEAMQYSLFQNSKRFRPQLALRTALVLNVSYDRVLPWAASVEMIHTYSLIHDDLPSMDNDNWRRGQPTNHIAFDEATALLAGDALLTEAFHHLSVKYKNQPEVAVELVQLLAEKSGVFGMIAGQTLDLQIARGQTTHFEELTQMHRLKTGALIEAAVLGVAEVARAAVSTKEALKIFAKNLGLAFQLADDIQDAAGEKIEKNSYPVQMGLKKTKEQLNSVSQAALSALRHFGEKAQPLAELIEFNKVRLI